MPRSKRTKDSYKRDENGRVILGSAKEMADWVKLGFEEQDKRKSPDIPFDQHYIDLRKCVLYISYPIDSKTPTSQIFNLCDMAGVVPGIEKIEGDPNYLFEVNLDIRFDGSSLYGNFFHYVKFNGMVNLDDVTVRSSYSCFKCLFQGFVYMQGTHLEGGFTFEQCEFSKGLEMSGAVVGGINAQFNNCIVKERLSLRGASFKNYRIKNYTQLIELTNSTVDNLSLSSINTDELPVYIDNTTIRNLKMHDMKMEAAVGFYQCDLDGIITAVQDETKENIRIKELVLHCCNVKAQYHIENCEIDKLSLTFDKIEDCGRYRLSQCDVKELIVGSTSVFGQMDVIENKISSVDMEGSCVHGYLTFQGNEVEKYEDRQTLRLLKNEAIKVNDAVSAQQLFAKEMLMLLADKSVSVWDKVSLWLNKIFSKFGESWGRAILVTLGLSIVLTLLMLGLGSGMYMFDSSGEFIGLGAFATVLLDSINVFSIPLFSDTIKEYDLNVFGQVLYFVIKLVVAYGTYQFVVAFRKYGRS